MTEVTWEVWRSHARGGPDVLVRAGMSEDAAFDLRAACEGDGDLSEFCGWYVVKATTTREKVPAE